MSDGKRYYWLKLREDFFTSKRIKKLRRLAGGDTYTIIYLKMQLKALKTDGVLEYTGVEPSFAEEIALDLDENPEDVKVTLSYLLTSGLAEAPDDISIALPYVWANTGSETASTQRVRDYRERQKALHCNADETQVKRIGNAEKEIEIEKEIDKDTTCFGRVVDAWNSIGLATIRAIKPDSPRGKSTKARISEYGLDEVLRAIENVRNSDFLMGGGERGWQASFDWLISPQNFVKVLEGTYTHKRAEKPLPVQSNAGKAEMAKYVQKLKERRT